MKKKSSKHKLWKEDIELFKKMEGNYKSANEENFFKNIRYKQEYEVSTLNDLLVSEYENPDELYLVRMYYEEYVIGHKIDSDGKFEVHVMNLSEALAVNLKEQEIIDKDITLLEWLRASDYIYVNYDRNNDF